MKKYNGEKAIISLTSWKKRLPFLAKSINSIIEKCPGFHIVCVLSSEEINKESDLPKDFINLIATNKIELLWVKKNYRSFKKAIFTALKYPDVPIISADDGALYTENFAQILFDKWSKNKSCIVSTTMKSKKEYNGLVWGSGCRGIIYPPAVFNKYAHFLEDQEIIDTNNDDLFIGYLAFKDKIKWLSIAPPNKKIHNFVNIPEAEASGLTKNKMTHGQQDLEIFKRKIK